MDSFVSIIDLTPGILSSEPTVNQIRKSNMIFGGGGMIIHQLKLVFMWISMGCTGYAKGY
jgi:hypothetical protein